MQGFFQRFLSVYRPLISRLNVLLGNYNLSYSLWQVIFYVKSNGPSTLVEISNYYNVEKPTITRRVQRLLEQQIIASTPGKDKREKVIQLTASGEEIYQICRNEITEMESRVMNGIPEEVQTAIFQVLPTIQENIVKESINE